MKILIADSVSEKAVDIFRKQKDFQTDVRTGLSSQELIGLIADYDALVVRSATKVTAGVIDAAQRMKVIGRAGSGVDNIDLAAATRKGIIVMNTPGGNTISTAEHTLAMLLALARNIPQACASVRAGRWEGKKFQGVELRGKTLGVVGLGNVGKIVAERARGFDMKIIAYDPFITDETALQRHIRLVTLHELLAQSDFITLHTPLSQETRALLDEKALGECKRGVRIINCARGGIVDEKALAQALDQGMVGGVALDVFEKEPPDAQNPLLAHDRVIFTPHLGASTAEAQEMVAVLVAEQMVDALMGHGIRNALNMPSVEEKEMEELRSFLRLGKTIGNLQYQMAEGQMQELSIQYQGDFSNMRTRLITISIVRGLLQKTANIPVNEVNAMTLAQERGLKINETFSGPGENYLLLVSVCYTTSTGKHKVEGTVFGKNDIRIVTVDGFRLNATAQGSSLLYTNDDRPGMIAKVGAALAHNNINIAAMYLARQYKGGIAMVLVNVDDAISESVLKELRSLDGVHEVKAIEFA